MASRRASLIYTSTTRLTTNIGFFGYTDGATIANIGLENVDVTGNNNVGGLVGYNDGGGISNSYAAGTVEGNDEVGGLVGFNDGGDYRELLCYGERLREMTIQAASWGIILVVL